MSLVSNAWAGFGAAFGPLILLSLYWPQLSRDGAIAGLLMGTFVTLLWIYGPLEINGVPTGSWLYGIVPGFIANFITLIIVSKLRPQGTDKLSTGFAQMTANLPS